MSHAGIDSARYPGPEAMRWLWEETNLAWTGLYLPVAGRGYKDKVTWMRTYHPLREMGWGVAPLYVGKQRNSPALNSPLMKALKDGPRNDGRKDGFEACIMAAMEGIPKPGVIYFDFEGGDNATSIWSDYFAGWVEAVLNQHYRPGVYCSHVVANALLTDLRARLPQARPEVWAINYFTKGSHGIGANFPDPYKDYPRPEPSGSGFAAATSWQLGGQASIYWDQHLPGGQKRRKWIPVDLDSSVYLDPGTCRVDDPSSVF